MTKRRGRRLTALLLLGFLLLASAVVWRKSYGFTEGQRLRELTEQRTELDGKLKRLEGDIRSTLTLSRLGSIVERRLGLRVPADSQIIILTRQRGDSLP